MIENHHFVFNKTHLAACLVVLLSACATIEPKEVGQQDLIKQGRLDKSTALKEVEPIVEPLTLDEALARALKYNLDRRSRLMEEALAARQLDMTQLDMLPKLVAQAGYSTRDNDRISVSRDATTGAPVTSRFISQERSHTVYDAGLTWSLLDVGLGHSNSVQQADRLLIATEKRRKAMHLLMQDVRIAFWRVASAQKLREQVRGVITLAEEALSDSRQSEAQRIRDPVDALRYQRQLLENLRLLEAIDQELSVAHIELAALMNAPVGQTYKVVEPDWGIDAQALSVPMEFLEELVMAENADVREQFYNVRIAREEVRKTMLRMFPNLSFSSGAKYDTDSYLLNNQWNEAGIQLSFNIFNLFTAPVQKRFVEAGVALADQRRVAMQMAAVAQVHLARQQVSNAMAQYNRADAIWQTDKRISEHVANRQRVQALGKLEAVNNQTTAILSLLRRYQAMAQVQAAQARLQATVGLEPKIGSVGELSLRRLTELVGRSENLLSLYQARGKVRPQGLSESKAQTQERTAEEPNATAFALANSVIQETDEAGAVQRASEPQNQSVSDDGAALNTDDKTGGDAGGPAETELDPSVQAFDKPQERGTDSTESEQAKTQEALQQALEQWAQAWSQKDTSAYLAMYAQDFEPINGMSRKAWSNWRTRRIQSKQTIQLDIRDVQVSLAPAHAIVKFEQRYADERFEETDQKMMHWVLREGQWLIAREVTSDRLKSQ